MVRVVVVGGGVAGLSAALAASRHGAKTTLLESSKKVGVSRALMPFLISEGWAEDDLILPQVAELAEAGVEVRTGLTVTSVQHKERTLQVDDADRRRPPIGFDSVVIATGAASQVPALRGISKPKVFILKGPADYVRLSTQLEALQTIVVSGPVPLGLRLGEILANKGKRVFVYCGREGLAHQFSDPVAAAIRRQVSVGNRKNEVKLVDASIDSVLGVHEAEAVASSGSVRTCDGVVVVPRSVPVVPAVGCERGRNGGLLVDASMSTSLRGVFAAGDSAEIKFKSGSVTARLHSTSIIGGEVAGVNAAGGKASASPSWAVGQTYFGLELSSAGLGEEEALAIGLDAGTETGRYREVRFGGGRETLISMVYDRASHQVYGLQIAGWGASSLSSAASMTVSLGLRVEQLLRMEFPYSPGSSYEISPISLTARKILDLEGS